MAGLEWKIDGRRVPQSRVADALAKSLQKEMEQEVTRNLSRVRCPVHGSTPRNIRFTGSIGRGGQIKADCCCDQLEAAISRALN